MVHAARVALLSKLPYAETVALVELFLVDPIELVVVFAFAVTGATVTSSGIFSPALPRAAGMPITIAAAITKLNNFFFMISSPLVETIFLCTGYRNWYPAACIKQA